ncbi:MAG: helix-turn-helix domain-containing protein [Caenispirillum sp.]|nr:helix-turn-helix domain-containing protein [Caenispirillum sp.]
MTRQSIRSALRRLATGEVCSPNAGQAMTRPVDIDDVLDERKAVRREKQARIAKRRAEILQRLPTADDTRWKKWLIATRRAVVTARKSVGLTQAEAGLLVGVSLRTYRDWEAGKADLQAGKVVHLCGLFGLTVSLSANGQNSAHPQPPEIARDLGNNALVADGPQDPSALQFSAGT